MKITVEQEGRDAVVREGKGMIAVISNIDDTTSLVGVHVSPAFLAYAIVCIQERLITEIAKAREEVTP